MLRRTKNDLNNQNGGSILGLKAKHEHIVTLEFTK